jgi:hypothetical protein
MRPKYEEKTFESYFNNELDRRTSIYFPFGQVQEGGIGADAAGYSRNRWLWRHLGYALYDAQFEGADLREIADEMERHLGREISNIPSIKANLLFQYKRPELIISKLGSEWKHWEQKYFRYDIYHEQQVLLERLVAMLNDKALVLYASPALESVDDLVDAKQRECLIESTNFRPASQLSGHHRNTYVKAGIHSIACSEPEQFEKFDLLAQLQQLENVSLNKVQPSERDKQKQIVEFAKAVGAIAIDNAELRRAYASEINIFVDAKVNQFPLFFSMVSMSIFRQLSGVQWVLATNSSYG